MIRVKKGTDIILLHRRRAQQIISAEWHQRVGTRRALCFALMLMRPEDIVWKTVRKNEEDRPLAIAFDRHNQRIILLPAPKVSGRLAVQYLKACDL